MGETKISPFLFLSNTEERMMIWDYILTAVVCALALHHVWEYAKRAHRLFLYGKYSAFRRNCQMIAIGILAVLVLHQSIRLLNLVLH